MTIHQSDFAALRKAMPYPSEAGVVVGVRGYFTVPTTIAANDIIELLGLPPGCSIVDAVFDSDDLDSGGSPAIVWDLGLMSGTFGSKALSRTCGNELFASVNTSQAGGVARPTKKEAYRVGPSSVARGIGAKLVTVAATPAAGVVGLTLSYTAV